MSKIKNQSLNRLNKSNHSESGMETLEQHYKLWYYNVNLTDSNKMILEAAVMKYITGHKNYNEEEYGDINLDYNDNRSINILFDDSDEEWTLSRDKIVQILIWFFTHNFKKGGE